MLVFTFVRSFIHSSSDAHLGDQLIHFVFSFYVAFSVKSNLSLYVEYLNDSFLILS